MAVSTIGTKVFIIDPEGSNGPTILSVDCAISIDGLGAPREQNDVTCLEDTARRFIGGLATPGTLTMTINADPQSESHIRLHEMYVAGTRFDMAIGWGDGAAVPTISSDDSFDFPTDRTFIEALDTYVSDFPFTFNLNSVVQSALTFQLSGFPTLYPKSVS
jgi:Phage tail tube, TTP, lambda-like